MICTKNCANVVTIKLKKSPKVCIKRLHCINKILQTFFFNQPLWQYNNQKFIIDYNKVKSFMSRSDQIPR